MGARYTARASTGFNGQLYIANGCYITVDGLCDEAAPTTPISDAVLTATLVDPQGVNVPNAVGIALAAVSGTPGSYRGVVPASVTATLTAGYAYTVKIVASNYDYQTQYDTAAAMRVG